MCFYYTRIFVSLVYDHDFHARLLTSLYFSSTLAFIKLRRKFIKIAGLLITLYRLGYVKIK